MVYLLLSNLLLLVFFLIYHSRLRKLTFFNWNRWYLLGSTLLAFGIPYILFVDFQLPEVVTINLPYVELNDLYSPTIAMHDQQGNWGNTVDNLTIIYWIGVLVSMLILLVKIFFLVKQNSRNDGIGSYSFFWHIHIGKEVKDNEMIRTHEEIHVKKGHSYDLFFIEIIHVFNWFNPLFYFIKQALKMVHECQVDNHFSANKVAYAELLVAQSLQVDIALLRHDFSNQSIVKKRIQMLFKKTSAPADRFNYLLVLPISLLGLFLIKNSQANPTQYELSYDDFKLGTQFYNAKSPLELFNYEETDQPPVYPGGIDVFRKEVYSRYVISEQAILAKIKGIIEVSFIINNKGEVEDLAVIRDLGYGSGESAIAAIKRSKTWSPAIKNGRAVSVRYVLPIRLDFSQ